MAQAYGHVGDWIGEMLEALAGIEPEERSFDANFSYRLRIGVSRQRINEDKISKWVEALVGANHGEVGQELLRGGEVELVEDATRV